MQGTEDLVIVYINPHSNFPVYLYGSPEYKDMNEIAEAYVPDGVPYNIININELHDPAVPALMPSTIEKENLPALYYEYLSAL